METIKQKTIKEEWHGCNSKNFILEHDPDEFKDPVEWLKIATDIANNCKGRDKSKSFQVLQETLLETWLRSITLHFDTGFLGKIPHC